MKDGTNRTHELASLSRNLHEDGGERRSDAGPAQQAAAVDKKERRKYRK